MAHINGEGDGVGLVIDLAGLPLREHECASELVGFQTREFADQPVFNGLASCSGLLRDFAVGFFACAVFFGLDTRHTI